jgi:hypothetical protein
MGGYFKQSEAAILLDLSQYLGIRPVFRQRIDQKKVCKLTWPIVPKILVPGHLLIDYTTSRVKD